MIITNVTPFTNLINSTESNLFKEFDISDAINISVDQPEIKRIVECLAYPNINKIDVIDTIDTISNEGEELNGNKLMIEVDLKERIIYTTKSKSEYVYTYNINTLKNLAISVPKTIKEKPTFELIKSGRLQINPYVENIHIRKIDDTNIYRTILLLLEVKFLI